MLNIFSCPYWPLVYLLRKNVYSDPLFIKKLGYLCVMSSLYILDKVPYQICDFSYFQWCPLFFVFVFSPTTQYSLQDLSSPANNWTQATTVKAPAPKHCTTREFPVYVFKIQLYKCDLIYTYFLYIHIFLYKCTYNFSQHFQSWIYQGTSFNSMEMSIT